VGSQPLKWAENSPGGLRRWAGSQLEIRITEAILSKFECFHIKFKISV
jgi:hypothetical protein